MDLRIANIPFSAFCHFAAAENQCRSEVAELRESKKSRIRGDSSCLLSANLPQRPGVFAHAKLVIQHTEQYIYLNEADICLETSDLEQ